MDASNITRLETSFNLLAPRGPELIDRFYATLLSRYPEVRTLFPQDMKLQKMKLLSALVLVVESLRRPAQLNEVLLDMGKRHVAYGVKEEHYPYVRDTLLEVMREMAGKAWTPQLEKDWTDALNLVAETMLVGASEITNPTT